MFNVVYLGTHACLGPLFQVNKRNDCLQRSAEVSRISLLHIANVFSINWFTSKAFWFGFNHSAFKCDCSLQRGFILTKNYLCDHYWSAWSSSHVHIHFIHAYMKWENTKNQSIPVIICNQKEFLDHHVLALYRVSNLYLISLRYYVYLVANTLMPMEK